MEIIKAMVALAMLACSLSAAKAQTAQDNILLANAETTVLNSKCDSAMQLMQKLSAGGKESRAYYSLMGKIYECKNNRDYALIYYNKALDRGAVNDSLRQKVSVLKGDTQPKAIDTAATLERERRKLEQNTGRVKHFKHNNVEDFYFVIAIGYAKMTGGTKAMAKRGIITSFTMGAPIIHNKFTLDFTPSLGVVYGNNPSWWNDPAVNNTQAEVGDGTGLQMGVEGSLNYILVTSRNHTLVCGAMVGAQLVGNGAWIKQGSKPLSNGGTGFACMGPRVAYYGWANLYVAAEYVHVGLGRIGAAIDEHAKVMPVNLDMARIDIGVRINYR